MHVHLSFAGVQLEATAEHPVTDGIHTVRNPDKKAFSLVWLAVTVDLRIISIHMALGCVRMTLSSSAVYIVKRSGPGTKPWGTPHVIEVENDASLP